MPIATETNHSLQLSLTILKNFPRNSIISICQEESSLLSTRWTRFSGKLKKTKTEQQLVWYLKYCRYTNNSHKQVIFRYSFEDIFLLRLARIELIEYLASKAHTS
jgi:hypothetical protein